jgi:hypothetical protein
MITFSSFLRKIWNVSISIAMLMRCSTPSPLGAAFITDRALTITTVAISTSASDRASIIITMFTRCSTPPPLGAAFTAHRALLISTIASSTSTRPSTSTSSDTFVVTANQRSFYLLNLLNL